MIQTSFYLYEMFFKALSNRTRFEIIRSLRDKPKSVTQLSNELKFEQSRVSHNLKKLEHCGFVQSEINGKLRIYSIDSQYIVPIIDSIDKYIEKYDKRLKVCSVKLK